jgi:[acyl-carrier-protein] S-malonyltransferase
MGKELHDAYPTVRALFDEASEVLGVDMRGLCFEGPEATLVQTENVQPAITLVDLSVHAVLREEGFQPAVTAGHSLGEYSALCAAGAFSFADTMRLVQVRGRAMQAAADRNPGGMAAVIGLDADALEAICAEVGGVVQVANHNSNSQVAITGEKEALGRATALAKERGAKLVVPLKVSGAWHSRLMEEAQGAMRDALEECDLGEPEVPVIANVTAEPHAKDSVIELLVRQIVSPVRWATSMRTLIADGHQTFVEVGPGRVLTGFFKDIDRSVTAVNVQDADTLEKARPTLAEATA